MKKATLSVLAVMIIMSITAQTPRSFKYQAVVRDASGEVIPNQNIGMRITILQDSMAGGSVYCETHTAVTNAYGLVDVEIGTGAVVSGSFTDILWGFRSHYMKTEVDGTGGTNYVYMGTAQLLSVPYANHAVTSEQMPVMTTAGRDSLQSPQAGLQIYNSTTNCINYFNGVNWYENCGSCTPMPTQAWAGPDQYFSDTTTSAILGANTPQYGVGTWSVISGTGGIFTDIHDPTTVFTGQPCTAYTLQWTISTGCGSTSDDVYIEFDDTPTQADAGPDQWYISTTYTTLEGNTPVNGTGVWQIVSGTGGIIPYPNNPISIFIGTINEVYVLKWAISTECTTSMDSVVIHFGDVFICGVPLIDARDGQWYNTVQIGSQCWMAENINIGTMIGGSNNQSNNGTIEKYCYFNNMANCDVFGGLYQWSEMMQYDTAQGIQGICPLNWHIPTDEEIKKLEGEVDSQYGYPDPEWDQEGYRGYDAGLNLKSTTGWNSGGNGIDLYGFSVLPGGYRSLDGDFYYLGDAGTWWSSTETTSTSARRRNLTSDGDRDEVYRGFGNKDYGRSIRCVHD